MESFFQEFLGSWSYLGLFVVLLAAGFGLPLPEDIPLILSGFLVDKTGGNLWLMMFTGLAGVIIGDSTLFLLGRRYGTSVMEHRWFRRIAKPWLVKKAQEKFEHHGAKILFAARFMPGLRSILFLTAGTFRLPYWKMLAFDGAAALISVPAWIWAGWYFSSKIEDVFASARVATIVFVSIAGVGLIVWGVYEYYHNLRKKGHELSGVEESASEVLEEARAPLASGETEGPEKSAGADTSKGVPGPSEQQQADSKLRSAVE